MIEENVDTLRLVGEPGHLARETIRRSRTGGDDLRIGRSESAVKSNVDPEGACLAEETAVESAVFRSAPDEPSERLLAADDARDFTSVVERRPLSGTEIEVALDADAVQKIRNRFRLRSGLDDLQVTDEAHADVGFRFMDLDLASRAGECDGRGQTGRSGAGNANDVR